MRRWEKGIWGYGGDAAPFFVDGELVMNICGRKNANFKDLTPRLAPGTEFFKVLNKFTVHPRLAIDLSMIIL